MEKLYKCYLLRVFSTILDTILSENELPVDLGDKWKSSYVTANASCHLDDGKKKSFISMQEHKVQNKLPITASNVITTIEKWTANEVLCLAIELSRYPLNEENA